VREVFSDNFSKRGELGASFCAYKDGRKVADLWGGVADLDSGALWEEDTLCLIFSSTKGVVAACCLMLADRGKLDYDAPIATYWPEFAREGKDAITVRQLMNHRSGLAGIETPLTIDDFAAWDPVVAAMEAQKPMWEPGTAQGYHGVSYGPFMSELFRRVEGRTVGRFLADEVAGPLGAELHIGLPEALDDRVAMLYPMTMGQRIIKALPYIMFNDCVERRLLKAIRDKSSLTSRAFASPAELGVRGVHNFNLKRVRRLELPWANGIATARGLARMYAVLAEGGELDGVRLVRSETIEPVKPRQTFEPRDRILHKPLGWSQGFIKEEPHLFSPNLESFGHPGAGGALGFCDPTRRMAWGYTMNKLDFRLRSPRAIALSQALYSCPGAAQ